ncbi:uncharacterized protein TNCV_4460301 [Trichonephila clavipes]|nr:uncharacterized protein TNCV_4460301 [Trichonephila clavipes]
MWYDGLTYKLIKLKFPGYLIKIVYNYLHNRTFRVREKNTFSTNGLIQSGIPQGSSLSPSLYNIYTHDFPEHPIVSTCLFADDSAMLTQGGIKTITEENKLPLLCNYVTSNVYQFINDCTTYAQAISILDSLFIKKRNVIFARHCLSTRVEETVSEYLQILNQLSKDCDFTDVKAEEYRKVYIRDVFIRGLKCLRIRQRLLENTSMTLDQAFEQAARTLESAEVHAASYMGSSFPVQSAAMKTEDFSEETVATSAASSSPPQGLKNASLWK